MRGITRLLATAIAVLALGGLLAASASASAPKLKLLGSGQKSILSAGALKVKVSAKVKGHRAKRVTVKGLSSTFDHPGFSALTGTKTLVFRHTGQRTVKLPLTAAGRKAAASCEARTLEVKAGGSKSRADLVRQTASCKPKPVDLSQASLCDFIGQQKGSRCMLPFPDDFYTRKDSAGDTGRRIYFQNAALPANVSGSHMIASDYNGNDGFSPGQTIVLRVPGLDNPAAMTKTGAVAINQIGRYKDRNAPVVVIDAETGKRWPVWVEIDSNAATPADTALLIHPAKNFAAGHRYVVALRDLKTSAGTTIAAPEGFRYYRDDLPSSKTAINKQRKRFEAVFRTLRKAGVARADLYLAWDFTVASDLNIASRLLQIRDDAFSQLGDTNLSDGTVTGTAPAFTVTEVDLNPNTELARRVKGTFTVPCYMTSVSNVPCAPGSRYNLDSNGVPVQNGTWTANFDCIVPHSIVDDAGHSPGRPVVYGHGLLGDAGEVASTPQRTLSQSHKFMHCATDEIGFSENDIATAIAALGDMSKFPLITDRTQQGLLDELYLGRLMDNPAGFASVKAFHVDQTEADTHPNETITPGDPTNPSVIDTSKLYYNGNSQGGILGGAFMAISPDATRGSLGVPGMNYSVLLNRSTDFATYQIVLNPAYPSKLEQAQVLAIVQMLWDRSEANGYARRMTDDPLPDTPAHKVLMDVAFGDHQVTTWQADTEARTIGAQTHDPVIAAGRWPGVDPLYGIPRIAAYPYTGSAIVYWDGGPLDWSPGLGTDPPPLTNTPNESGDDPHSLPRNTPAEQQMVSDFLQPDNLSQITDTCSGLPCFSGTYTGP
ncbi:MAG: hypothetical protein U0R52_14155 [Solirubrobacterales bacterium]